MPTFQTPQLIITTAGLAAASVATPTGPFIEIDKFQIGSAYGYTPQKTDTSINGDLLFEGAPLTYKYVGDNTLDIVCRLPVDAGPFQFGEVALFLTGGVMFAKAAFADPQIKYSSLGTNVLSTYTFNCLLKLDQSVAVFKINTNCLPPDIWEVDLWSDVYPSGISANPDIPAILVREPDVYGNSTLITKASDVHWSMAGNYRAVNQGTVVASTTTSIDFAQSELINVNPGTLANEYVIETADGYLRACSSEVFVGSNIRFNLTAPLPVAPPVGSKIILNSMLTNQTRLIIEGSASGSAIIKGSSVHMNLAITPGAALARSQTWKTAGIYQFTVPDDVHFLYLDGGGAGAGGGGAGGGWPTSDWPYTSEPGWTNAQAYLAGGGGGGGGAGHSETSLVIPVNPGEIVTIVIGAKGLGGAGGAPGNNGIDGTDGGATTISGSFGTITLPGGTGGGAGAGYGLPSGQTGAGGPPGLPGGFFGIDGHVGCAGGNGGTSPFGAGGPGGRGATAGPGNKGADGGDGSDNSSGGGGGGAVYIATSTNTGGDGGDGTDGFANLRW